MKKILKIMFINIVAILIISQMLTSSFAETSTELKNQQKDIDKQIEETNTEIAGVKSKMTKALSQINNLNAEISTYENEIDNLNNQIQEKQKEIEYQEEQFIIQKELLDARLVAMYENGETSYLDMLLSSEGLTDFISNYYMISQLAEFDQELLNKIEDTKNKIESEKVSLENAQNEIESKKSSLNSTLNSKKSLVSNLSDEELELQKKLEEMEEDRKEIQKRLAQLAKKETATASSVPSEHGYIFPVAGCSKSNINNLSYPSYNRHTGIDVNINVNGKNVVAVKSGTVAISTALRNKDGSYRSYGEYVVINHHDGTMTLYAHMLSGSRKVTEGQEVSQGQVLGTVGSTGNSTGTHLHFEVLIKGSPVNPIPYLP